MNEYITQDFVKNVLPKRKRESNKSTFGRVLLVCGSDSMRGAAALAARGALRLGAGLVTLASAKSVIDTLSASLCEPIYLDVESGDLFKTAEKMQVIGLGCGLGTGETTAAWTAKFLSSAGAPLILDADGINVLEGHAHLLHQAKRPVLLTPHPLEFSRLSGLTVKAIQADRAHIARTFAAEYGITLLLKGANTVVTDGKTTLINPTGSSALAKGEAEMHFRYDLRAGGARNATVGSGGHRGLSSRNGRAAAGQNLFGIRRAAERSAGRSRSDPGGMGILKKNKKRPLCSLHKLECIPPIILPFAEPV